ncbi:L-ribulose-5-phosphate 4-epimerase [Cutibacterium acnes JCM 18909]|nr:L-ribulose-5-phosphate 4-epimerase [Cutibacterium acnes JCM 18909]
MLEKLKTDVCRGNLELPRHGLVTWTSGNLSVRDLRPALSSSSRPGCCMTL